MPGRIRKFGITISILLGLPAAIGAETVVQDMEYHPIVVFNDAGEFAIGNSDAIIGKIDADGKIYNGGIFIGVDKGGTIIDPDYNVIGYYKSEGHILDANYTIIGYMYEGGRLVNADMQNVGYFDGEQDIRMFAIYVLFFENIFGSG